MDTNSTYNGWGLKLRGYGTNYSCLAKRHLFAKNKLGHDDEVNRVAVFKSRHNARKAKLYLSKKLSKKRIYDGIKIEVVKVRVGVTEVSSQSEKDFI